MAGGRDDGNIVAKLDYWQLQHADRIRRDMKRLLSDEAIDTAMRRLNDNYLGDGVIAEIIDVSAAFVGALRWYAKYGKDLK